jgi:hypothetical protein
MAAFVQPGGGGGTGGGLVGERGEDAAAYRELAARGRARLEGELWNGRWFVQRVQWQGLRAGDPTTAQSMMTTYTPEARAILEREGPKYQYGTGCLIDGILGDWLARCAQLPPVADPAKVRGHLASVVRHNLRADLSAHANPQRPGYALGDEAGVLMCTWPDGDRLSLPFPYSEEVFTGSEYQLAAHLAMLGRTADARRVVRGVRGRYDGRKRNPFDEYECGHWYARALSSWSLLQAFSGASYDAVSRVLTLDPRLGRDWRCLLSTVTGFGMVGMRRGKPFLTVVRGEIPVTRIAVVGC